MIDFAKLNDPAWKEKCRLEREKEAKRLEELDAEQSKLVAVCDQNLESLTPLERRFVNSSRWTLARGLLLNDKDTKWLRDIVARFPAL